MNVHHGLPGSPPTSLAQRVLDEGPQPLLEAARAAGLNAGALPSSKTLMRAAISGKLEAIKVAGRWLTSPQAIVRWIDAAQHRRNRYRPALDQASADEVLVAHGLGRNGGDGGES